jgi:FkbM family methyltransferase
MHILKSIRARYNAAFNRETNELFLRENKEIDRRKFPFFYDARYYVNILKSVGATFTTKEDRLYTQIGALTFFTATQEELFILAEIFVDKCYSFSMKSSCIVVDIGMNVAFASIYFATQKNVQHVYSFEPFKATYNGALQNINLNPSVKNKITTYNYGLGKGDTLVETAYSAEWKGSMGIYGSTKSNGNEVVPTTGKEMIEIKDATKALDSIVRAHPSMPLFIKMDCEGAEYDIFESLKSWEGFSNVKALTIEWHDKGPSPLLEILNDNGFITFEDSDPTYKQPKVGMLYSCRIG